MGGMKYPKNHMTIHYQTLQIVFACLKRICNDRAMRSLTEIPECLMGLIRIMLSQQHYVNKH